jgi:hypothetical protein
MPFHQKKIYHRATSEENVFMSDLEDSDDSLNSPTYKQKNQSRILTLAERIEQDRFEITQYKNKEDEPLIDFQSLNMHNQEQSIFTTKESPPSFIFPARKTNNDDINKSDNANVIVKNDEKKQECIGGLCSLPEFKFHEKRGVKRKFSEL